MNLEKPTLQGSNVTLRPLTTDDAKVMYPALKESEIRQLTGTHKVFSREDIELHCAMVAESTDRWDYGIEVDGQLIGDAALMAIDTNNASASFRIAIWFKEMRDKGFGTEATRLLIGFGFRDLDLHRIELEVYAFNPRAQNVYENVGFKLEGTKRQALKWENKWIDAKMMAMLADDHKKSISGS